MSAQREDDEEKEGNWKVGVSVIVVRPPPYLIFVTNAANAVRVKFLAECKKIPEKRENYCFGLRLYHNSDHVNVLFYTKCAILHRYQCFILHLVFDFTLGV